jgi:hypothetical protein
MWLERWVIYWLRPITPVYKREAARNESVRRAGANAKKSWRAAFFYFAWAAAIFICILSFLGVYTLQLWVPVIILTLMVILQVRVVAAASDAIVRDTEARTWDLLRLIPWPMHRLVKTKYAIALTRTRHILYQLFAVRIAFFFAFILLFNRPFGYFFSFDTFGALAVLYYCLDPLFNFATDNALGLTISAFAQSRNQALVYGLALGSIAVGAHLALTASLLWLSSKLNDAAYILLIGSVVAARYLLLQGLLSLTTRRISSR